MNDFVSPQLYGAIRRSFGSIRDLQRALRCAAQRKLGKVYLVALPNEKLQVVCAPGRPLGTVLMTAEENCTAETLSARYADFIARRPEYPCP